MKIQLSNKHELVSETYSSQLAQNFAIRSVVNSLLYEQKRVHDSQHPKILVFMEQ